MVAAVTPLDDPLPLSKADYDKIGGGSNASSIESEGLPIPSEAREAKTESDVSTARDKSAAPAPSTAYSVTQGNLIGGAGLVAVIFLSIGVCLGLLIGLHNCPEIEVIDLDDGPTTQPTLLPTNTSASTDPCDVTFAFGTMSRFLFVNATQLEFDCALVDVVPFMDYLLEALRFECVAGNVLALLGLCVMAQLGGVPKLKQDKNYNSLGAVLWFIWMILAVFQYITTLISQLMSVLAAMSFAGQYQDEFVLLEGGLNMGLGVAFGAGGGVFLGCIFFLSPRTISRFFFLGNYTTKAKYVSVLFATLGSGLGVLYYFYKESGLANAGLCALFGLLIGALLGHFLFYSTSFCVAFFWQMLSPVHFCTEEDANGVRTFMDITFYKLLSHKSELQRKIYIQKHLFETQIPFFEKMSVMAFLAGLCSCFGAFYGSFTGSPLFNAIIPSLIFHPTFLAKNAALCVYAFTIFQGIAATGYATDIDKLMRLYASVMIAPLMAIGVLFFIFTISFIFSFIFFAPIALCLAGVFAVCWLTLDATKKSSKEPSINITQSINVYNPLSPLHGSLWWLPDGESASLKIENISGCSTMLIVVLFSSLLIVFSPLIVFGQWTAFFFYLDNGLNDDLTYVSLIYQHFFGAFVDFKIYIPNILSLNLDDISEWLSALQQIPSFDSLPPAAMLEGSTIFAILGLFMAFMKPLICALSYISFLAGIVGNNENIGKLAESYGSVEGNVTKLSGYTRKNALKDKHLYSKDNSDGKIEELSREPSDFEYTFLFDIEFVTSEYLALVKLDLRNCRNVTGRFTGDIIILISDVRQKHGQEAVNLSNCGRFVLAENLTNIANITHIDLSSIDSLEGDIGFLAICNLLENFIASGCKKLSGNIGVLANCKFLKEFSANNCENITGDIHVFENMPKVTCINLQNTKCSGDIDVLTNCVSLEKFIVWECENITGDIKVFEHTPLMKILWLRGTRCIGDIKVFQHTPLVTDYRLSETKCAGDIAILAHCKSLTNFAAQSTGVTGDISVLANCQSLFVFSAAETGITGDISVFDKTPGVTRIFLNYTKCTGDIGVLANCKVLWKFSAEFCNEITGDIKVFENISSVENIWLNGTQCTGEKEGVTKALPMCKLVF